MEERPSLGFWIAGTLVLLVFSGCMIVPAIVALGGGKYVAASAMIIVETLYHWGGALAGAVAAAVAILSIVWFVNRRRPPR
jgi:hypothetical protein